MLTLAQGISFSGCRSSFEFRQFKVLRLLLLLPQLLKFQLQVLHIFVGN
jgi:hypothetical protein